METSISAAEVLQRMGESFGTMVPRLIALFVGAVVGFLAFGPIGLFFGTLGGLIVLVALDRQGE